MTQQLHIVHARRDGDLVGYVIDFLEAAFPSCKLTCTAYAGYTGQPQTALLEADAVAAVLSQEALLAADVPFELGVAHCMGKPTIVVLDDTVDPTRLALPLPPEHVALAQSYDSLLAAGRLLAAALGIPFGLGQTLPGELTPTATHDEPATPQEVMADLAEERQVQSATLPIPEFDAPAEEQPTPLVALSVNAVESGLHHGPLSAADTTAVVAIRERPPLTRPVVDVAEAPPERSAIAAVNAPGDTATTQGTEHAVEGEASGRHTDHLPVQDLGNDKVWPTCSASLAAGQAIARCGLEHPDTPEDATEMDAPFGSFMETLGADWAALRAVHNTSVWMGAADNVLDQLPSDHAVLRAWYDIGVHLATLINLADVDRAGENGQHDDLDERWSTSMAALLLGAERLKWGPASTAILEGMLENLRSLQTNGKHENVDRIQSVIHDHARQADLQRPGSAPVTQESAPVDTESSH